MREINSMIDDAYKRAGGKRASVVERKIAKLLPKIFVEEVSLAVTRNVRDAEQITGVKVVARGPKGSTENLDKKAGYREEEEIVDSNITIGWWYHQYRVEGYDLQLNEKSKLGMFFLGRIAGGAVAGFGIAETILRLQRNHQKAKSNR